MRENGKISKVKLRESLTTHLKSGRGKKKLSNNYFVSLIKTEAWKFGRALSSREEIKIINSSIALIKQIKASKANRKIDKLHNKNLTSNYKKVKQNKKLGKSDQKKFEK